MLYYFSDIVLEFFDLNFVLLPRSWKLEIKRKKQMLKKQKKNHVGFFCVPVEDIEHTTKVEQKTDRWICLTSTKTCDYIVKIVNFILFGFVSIKSYLPREIVFFDLFAYYFYCSRTTQKIKFFIKNFFSKCEQIRRNLRIWSYLLRKSLMENFIFCPVSLLLFSFLMVGEMSEMIFLELKKWLKDSN